MAIIYHPGALYVRQRTERLEDSLSKYLSLMAPALFCFIDHHLNHYENGKNDLTSDNQHPNLNIFK